MGDQIGMGRMVVVYISASLLIERDRAQDSRIRPFTRTSRHRAPWSPSTLLTFKNGVFVNSLEWKSKSGSFHIHTLPPSFRPR